jgi:hypothetical protein|tara:strand:- start:601 stop:888 length:288 start_codon:yes stop_codon:yes gene_type:complete
MSLTEHPKMIPKIEFDIQKFMKNSEYRYIRYYFWDDKTSYEKLADELDWNMGYGGYPQEKVCRYCSDWVMVPEEAQDEWIAIEGKVHYKKYIETN